jgi:Mg2+/Co2+ transporter CorB
LDEIPISLLVTTLIILIILSGCFSGSETALMSLNRYRLRHLAKAKHRGAIRANRLLTKPDRLIGFILLGNNFVNIAASFITTILTQRLFGDAGLAIAAGLLTLVILIFAEVTPKTLAALHPERIAFPVSFVIEPILRLVYYPLVWPISLITNGILKIIGIRFDQITAQELSREELRTVVNEAGAMIPGRHQKMLTSILDLEQVAVEDIMVPRNEIVGIDLDAEWDEVMRQITSAQHTRLPVYQTDINKIVGIFHVRNMLRLLAGKEFTRDDLMTIIRDPYFVPEATPLHTQLLNFQTQKRRIALVVDEYGDIQGLITLEDILEEIVGEFTTDPSQRMKDVHPQEDGSFLVDGSVNIRELNRTMHWKLPTDGPKTLNGLILEFLEAIPEPGTSFRVEEHTIEIVQTKGNTVKIARVVPPEK